MFNDKTYSQKMDKTIEVFSKELTSLRTGRANANMLDLVKIDVYGQQMPINQVASITTPEARMINIQVWDLNNVPLVDSAIKKSELGLNPQIDGQLVRLPVPDLSEERRSEIKKVIKSMGEKCKVSIRNIRREANDDLKNLLKDKEILEKEKNLITEELKDSGKAEEITQKIILGKMNKFKEENGLLSQAWVMEPKKKVEDILKELSISDLKIKDFYRLKIGE